MNHFWQKIGNMHGYIYKYNLFFNVEILSTPTAGTATQHEAFPNGESAGEK